MPYAIIRTGGKQYRVEPGDVIHVESLPGEVGTEVAFPEVLLRNADSGLDVGSPLVDGASVSGKILAQGRARKILVYKKKRRKNYRRHQGHRQAITTVQVVAIG
jgi:large subunit ribosomal protein L21